MARNVCRNFSSHISNAYHLSTTRSAMTSCMVSSFHGHKTNEYTATPEWIHSSASSTNSRFFNARRVSTMKTTGIMVGLVLNCGKKQTRVINIQLSPIWACDKLWSGIHPGPSKSNKATPESARCCCLRRETLVWLGFDKLSSVQVLPVGRMALGTRRTICCVDCYPRTCWTQVISAPPKFPKPLICSPGTLIPWLGSYSISYSVASCSHSGCS